MACDTGVGWSTKYTRATDGSVPGPRPQTEGTSQRYMFRVGPQGDPTADPLDLTCTVVM